MSDSVSVEFVRQVLLQLLAGEWVDTNDVCSALDLDFKTCMHKYLYQNLSSRYPSSRPSKDDEKTTSKVFQFENSAGKFGAIIENDAKSADPEI